VLAGSERRELEVAASKAMNVQSADLDLPTHHADGGGAKTEVQLTTVTDRKAGSSMASAIIFRRNRERLGHSTWVPICADDPASECSTVLA
jgi:hypothetical protein